MDQDTHTLVLSSDESETGCTIHQVTEEVDKGEVLSQKKCDVVRMGDFPDDVDSLKKKVQVPTSPISPLFPKLNFLFLFLFLFLFFRLLKDLLLLKFWSLFVIKKK